MGESSLAKLERGKENMGIVDEAPPPARHRGRPLPQKQGSQQLLNRLKRGLSKM